MLKLLHIALILHAKEIMLKILHVRLQQYVNWELPGVQAEFRKGRGTREKLPDNWKGNGVPEKIYHFFIDYAKAFDCVYHNKLENS